MKSKDKAYLEASLPEFNAYLLSDELLWPVTARGLELPRMTIGGVLLAKARLMAVGERIESLVAELEVIRSKWRVAWEKKAEREIHMRSGLWRNFLEDYRHDPYRYAGTYHHEVRTRVMIQFLLGECSQVPPEGESIKKLDVMLQRIFIPGDFIWDMELQNGFPVDDFWFLYGTLKS